jgi:O-antigen ligase
MYKINDKSGRFGDLSRLISFDLATDIIGQHPITGVGAGDVLDEMTKGYIKKYPEVAPENRLIPHNQFLNMAVGTGLVFMILMVIWWLYPLTWCWKNKKGIFIFIGWLVLFSQMMVEPYLEGQFGVFVFTFYAILLYHLCTPQQSTHQA